jgi:hypothetical protein
MMFREMVSEGIIFMKDLISTNYFCRGGQYIWINSIAADLGGEIPNASHTL